MDLISDIIVNKTINKNNSNIINNVVGLKLKEKTCIYSKNK